MLRELDREAEVRLHPVEPVPAHTGGAAAQLGEELGEERVRGGESAHLRTVPEVASDLLNGGYRAVLGWTREDGGVRSMDRHDDYDRGALPDGALDPDPIAQFRRWLADAEDAGLPDPNAMVLSTIDPSGPTSRTVLLKALIDGRFEFVTNSGSRKGAALAADGRVSLAFPWYPLERQVLVDGDARPAPAATSDAYWATRPRSSRIGAWASHQSAPVADRAALDAQVAAAEERFAGQEAIPRPPFWGAWLVMPRRIEFWQGRPSRVHDRFAYVPSPGGWSVTRLQP